MWIRMACILLFFAAGHAYAQKACAGEFGPIIGCSSDSRHFPCYTSPDTMVKAMCPNGEGTATLLGKPSRGNQCGYHYFQISCVGASAATPSTSTQAQSSASSFVTGRIRCLENGEYPTFEITVQSSAGGESCASARQTVEEYFRSQDRCKYSSGGTYPNRSWDGKNIQWLQTNTCR